MCLSFGNEAIRPRAPGPGGMRRGMRTMAAASDREDEMTVEVAAISHAEEKNICKMPPVRPSPMQCLGNFEKIVTRWYRRPNPGVDFIKLKSWA